MKTAFRLPTKSPRVLAGSPDCTDFNEKANHKKTISLGGRRGDRNCTLVPILAHLHVNMGRMYDGIQC